jgi:tetratricopeptide (TPR) repeat protein
MKRSLLILGFSVLLLGCGLGPDMTKDRVPRPPSPTPFVPEKPIAEYMSEGRAAYDAGNFSEAVNSYKRAFEIEQREQKLEKKDLHQLLKNLGLAYSRTGDSKNARLVAAYGMSKDYGYPIYHYVLACSYGDEGIEGDALYHLRTMYSLKGKLPAGEKLPDPLSENCFASFSDSETFKKAVADMKRSR